MRRCNVWMHRGVSLLNPVCARNGGLRKDRASTSEWEVVSDARLRRMHSGMHAGNCQWASRRTLATHARHAPLPEPRHAPLVPDTLIAKGFFAVGLSVSMIRYVCVYIYIQAFAGLRPASAQERTNPCRYRLQCLVRIRNPPMIPLRASLKARTR